MIQPLLKPKDKKRKPVDAVRVRYDGKEICTQTYKGFVEYRLRTQLMAFRQDGICRWCEKPMYDDISFDHDKGRTKGNRDDRIENVDGERQNAAVHTMCNSERGSSRILTRKEWLEWKADKRIK